MPQPSDAPFNGFPETALDFYDDLEMDNTKTFWEAHRDVHAGSPPLTTNAPTVRQGHP